MNDAAAQAVWRQRGWVAQLRSLFADRYGDPGEGFLRPQTAGVYTHGGGIGVTSGSLGLGPYGDYYGISSIGMYVEAALPPCTAIRVYEWCTVPGTIPLYTIDGGADTNGPAAPAGTDTLRSWDIIGLSDAPHTIRIKKPSNGNMLLLGVAVFRKTDSGVAVHRVAKAGMILKDLTEYFDTDGVGPVRKLESATKLFGPDLVILAFSANNVTRGWTTYALTPAQVAAGFARIVDRIIANGSDVLVVVGPWRDPSSYPGMPFSQQQYDDAILAAMESRDRVASVDLKLAHGSYAAQNALGGLVDTVHPNLQGHSDIARLLFDVIGTL